MKQKFRKILVLLCILGVGCSILGCGSTEKKDVEETSALEAGEDQMTGLTKEEKDVLKELAIDEERIEEERLYSWEEKLVEQIRYGKTYLQEKYPGHTFVIMNCTPYSESSSYAAMVFSADGQTEKGYDLYVYPEEEGREACCEDNYYNEIIREEYEAYLRECLEKQGEKVLVSADFNEVKGKAYDGNLTVSDIFEKNLSVFPNVTLYLLSAEGSEAEYQNRVQELQQYLQEEKLSGFYITYFVETLPDQSENADSKYLHRDSFSIFEP